MILMMMTTTTYHFDNAQVKKTIYPTTGFFKLCRSIRTGVFMLLLFLLSLPLFSSSILIPMDAKNQANHLKAYGITYYALEKQLNVRWLLNYQGGSFLITDTEELRKECLIRGVSFEVISDSKTEAILQQIESPSKNMEAVILEKAPKIAVYAPQGNKPWDDAVTMALSYAEIPYETIYDEEVLNDALVLFDWLHLHHEDFTGQYGKFYRNYRTTPWYIQEKAEAEALAAKLGYSKVSEQKLAVALKIRNYVVGGGFMFAMCSATDS